MKLTAGLRAAWRRIVPATKQDVDKIMKTLDDIVTEVTGEKTVIDSAVTLLNGLSQQLKDALASQDPTKIQAVIDQIDANKQELADAITANTPAAPKT
jgi:ABC-type transporter Mla subunit MlaD